MITWNLILPIGAVISSCAIVMLFQWRRIRMIMMSLHNMLDRAIDGSFTEDSFDESLLSSVESKLNQYLSASAVSARNVKTEKEHIKELLADISHQTKTPIANILLYGQLLKEQDLPSDSMEYVEALNEQTEKLNTLLASLVKLSRLEAGVFTLHPASHSIAPMLEEAARQFLPKAAEKGIRLEVDSTDAIAVYDIKWTTEALCNLVDNALKYTPAGGSVQISINEYDLFYRINVTDTGIGIAEEEHAKIFTRFYRSQAVSELEGVGIGLYLTRQILAAQGGYIKVDSVLGKGAVFSIFLPRTS